MENKINVHIYYSPSPIYLLDEDLQILNDRRLNYYIVEVEDYSKPYSDYYFEFLYEKGRGFVPYNVDRKSYKKFTTDHPSSIHDNYPLHTLFLQIPNESYLVKFEDLPITIPDIYHPLILTKWQSGTVDRADYVNEVDRHNTCISYGKIENNRFHIIMTGVISEIEERLCASDDE
jgi:hypothetical protein